MDTSSQDIGLSRERERLYNFLKKYDLQQYYSKFLLKGVHRLTHLKDVSEDEGSLDEIGLSRIERNRLKKKVKENVAWKGKLVKKLKGKDKQFDVPAPEVTSITSSDASKEGRRAATIIPKEEVKLVRKIGEGAHGSVHEGTWADSHGAVAVAVKTLYVRQNSDEFIKEANSMATLHHKHIIQLFGLVLAHPLMLVEELAPFGSLYGYIKKEGTHVTLPLLHTYACQIADAMTYLESRRLVHRDLAIRNILLAQVDYVKLSDFGMARLLDENSEVYNLSNLATRIPIAWTAPEAIMKAQFSSASDVWSYGISLWEIYSTGNVPWKGLSPVEIRDLLVEGQRLARPERCPDDMFELMQACWRENPQKRPTFADIFKRVKVLVPRQVRAIKAHVLGDDPNALSFKTGDTLYIIDKSSSEWYNGMKMDGTVGHFRSDFVSEVVNPLDDIKAKVAAGKPVEDLCIGSPTHMDHMVHYSRDGSKWVSENAHALDDLTPPQSPGKRNSRSFSDPSVSPPLPFKVVDARSPSPKDSKLPMSPLKISASVGSTPLPYQVPVTTLVNLKTDADGKHHLPNSHQPVGRSTSTPPSQGRPRLHLRDLSAIDQAVSTPEADNQYISMNRAATLSTAVHGGLTQQKQDSGSDDPYVTMQSWSVNRPKSADPTASGVKGRSSSIASAKGFRNSQGDFLPERSRSVSTALDWSQAAESIQRLHTMASPSSGNSVTQQDRSHDTATKTPSDSHYNEPRSISTKHYQVPRTAISQQPNNAKSSETPNSLLDSSNSASENLPKPLIPVSTPSPSKTQRKSGPRKDSGSHRVPIDIQEENDVFLEKQEAAVTQSTQFYSSPNTRPAGTEFEPSPSRPVPRPRRTSDGVANMGQKFDALHFEASPAVPKRRGRSASEKAKDVAGLMSESSAAEMENHYQPLDLDTMTSGLRGDYVTLNTTAALISNSRQGVNVGNGSRQQEVMAGKGRVNAVSGSGEQRVMARNGSDEKVGAVGATGEQRVMAKRGSEERVNGVNGSSEQGGKAENSSSKDHGNGSVVFPFDNDDILEEILNDEEFSGCEVEICKFALEQHRYNLEKAKTEIRVQILLSMFLPNIREEDCRRALVHCQQKTNRAAAWLIQRSEELEKRAQ